MGALYKTLDIFKQRFQGWTFILTGNKSWLKEWDSEHLAAFLSNGSLACTLFKYELY